mmetsp:Transcript_102449/g.176906  ORF Transcript_102449/g.176906 Transcript_102449/m.176906 type:complete len:199 (-) Transcript_102449:19-615(-)
MFMGAVRGETASTGIQCMPAIVEPPAVPPSSPLAAQHATPSKSTKSHSDVATPSTSTESESRLQAIAAKYEKFGVILENGLFTCMCCNQSGFQADALRDHLITDAHEKVVWNSDWKYEVHSAGGFARREKYRGDRSDARQQRQVDKNSGTPDPKRQKLDIQSDYKTERRARRAENIPGVLQAGLVTVEGRVCQKTEAG